MQEKQKQVSIPESSDTQAADCSGSESGSSERRSKEEVLTLSATQELALEQLAAGASISGAARAARVDRRTVYRWLRDDPQFAAAYNAWRNEMVASGRARVLAMADLALDTVKDAMLQGNARVAVQVAKAAGALSDAPPRPAETRPDRIGRRRKLKAGRREYALQDAERDFRIEFGLDAFERGQHSIEYVIAILDWYINQYFLLLQKETPSERDRRMHSFQDQARTMCLLDRLLATAPHTYGMKDPPRLSAPYDFGPPVPGSPSAAAQAQAPAPPSATAPPPSLSLTAPAASGAAQSETSSCDAPVALPAPPPPSQKSLPIIAQPSSPPPRVRPAGFPLYWDGSDSMDNDPDWDRLV